MPRSFRAVGPLAAILVLATAACGQGTASTTAPVATTIGGNPAASAPNATSAGGNATAACDLLGADEVKEITGFTVASAEESNLANAYQTDCVWTFEENAWSIVIGVVSPGGAEFLDRTLEFEGGGPEIERRLAERVLANLGR